MNLKKIFILLIAAMMLMVSAAAESVPGEDSFEYDEKGNLIQVTYADGFVMKYEYDESNRQVRATDGDGNTLEEYEYFENGSIYKFFSFSEDAVYIYEFDEDGNLIQETGDFYEDDSKDYVYDYSDGNSVPGGDLADSECEYYESGMLKSQYLPDSGDTLFYSENGALLKYLYADGTCIIYRNDEFGGALTLMQYDSDGSFCTQEPLPPADMPDVTVSFDENGDIVYTGETLPDVRVTFCDETSVKTYNAVSDLETVYVYDEEGGILKIHREYTDADTIMIAQEFLNAAGYDCGTPDGVLGSGTAAVITQYQTDKELTVTGTVTYELLISLGVIEDPLVVFMTPLDMAEDLLGIPVTTPVYTGTMTFVAEDKYYDSGAIRAKVGDGQITFFSENGAQTGLLYDDGTIMIYRNDENGNMLTYMQYNPSGELMYQHPFLPYDAPQLSFSYDEEGNFIYSGEPLPDVLVVSCDETSVRVYDSAAEQYTVYEYDADANILNITKE